MTKLEKIKSLNQMLIRQMPDVAQEAATFADDEKSQRRLLRSLMNVRMPSVLYDEFIKLQDELLCEEREEKGVVHIADLPAVASDSRIILWQGDITRLDADAIVNAANSKLLGCFVPCHACIDNAIHSAAGLQLRNACHQIMLAQNHDEATGDAKITPAFNLPCKYVLHTVGPIIYSTVTEKEKQQLASCYKSCLKMAAENNLASVAFCCISTGEFHFPNEMAAEIAVRTVKDFFATNKTSVQKVVFNVFKDYDREIYEKLLG